MDLDDAQEIGYRKGLIKGRELQKKQDTDEILADLHPIEKKRLLEGYSKEDMCIDLLRLINKLEGRLNE